MRRKLLAPALLLFAVAVSGCASMPSEVVPSQSTQTSTELSMNDIMFAQMMIPHHEQAVELATLAESRTEYVIVLDLTARIKSAQEPEIDEMSRWLAESGSDMEMEHSMSMPGLVLDSDMEDIKRSEGDEFDVLFLTHMIAHHNGAVDMANDVLATTTSPRVRELATAIVASQTTEIAEMEALLYG